MTKQCACGRLVTAGWTGGASGHTHCLICETARLMRGWQDPITIKYQKKKRKATP